MRIAVIGGGGREHSLLWSLSNEKKHTLFALPGNGGTASISENVEIGDSEIDKILKFIDDNKIETVVIGPEKPLSLGLADRLMEKGVKVYGPVKEGAKIETSKVWSKMFMKKYDIPTADFEVFDDYEHAIKYVKEKNSFPTVIKVDGLAAGKGVFIVNNFEEADDALKEIMIEKKFGDAGNHVEIEEFLEGMESSYLVFVDGEKFVPMVTSKDHKNIFDGNKGPNTGGMGTFSPSPFMTPAIIEEANEIIKKAVNGFQKEGITYKGTLYAGLMLTKNGVKVLEFNARFGDPETQVIMPRLITPFSEIVDAVNDGMLEKIDVRWNDKATLCLIAASSGYPGAYQKGKIIKGLDKIKDATVFHAGTKLVEGAYYTSGGRVLGVTTVADTLEKAREIAYREMEKIVFEGIYYRKDIGVI